MEDYFEYLEREAKDNPPMTPQALHPAYRAKLPDKLLGSRWINHLATGTRLIEVTGYEYGTLCVLWAFSDGSVRHRTTIAEEIVNGTLVFIDSK